MVRATILAAASPFTFSAATLAAPQLEGVRAVESMTDMSIPEENLT